MNLQTYLNYKMIKVAAGAGAVMKTVAPMAGQTMMNQGNKFNMLNSGMQGAQQVQQGIDYARMANSGVSAANKGLQYMGAGSQNVATGTQAVGNALGNIALGANAVQGAYQAGTSGYNAYNAARNGDYYGATHHGINTGLGAANAGTSVAALAMGNPAIAAPAITANVAYNGTRALSDKYGMEGANKNLDQRMAQWQKAHPNQTPGFWTQANMVRQHMNDQVTGIATGLARDAGNAIQNGWNWIGNKTGWWGN